MKTLNAGLIGYKFMGKAHANAYTQVNHFFDADAKINLKAVCGRNKENVTKFQHRFGFESIETDYKQLINRNDIDFVDITAPSNVHKEMVLMAAEAKKHIFCEKPLAFNTKDAKEMLDCANKNHIKHQIGFNYRFVPAIRLAKKLIEDGAIGEIYHFRALYLQDWIVDPEFPLVWRLDKNICGSGANGDINAHSLDLARFLIGEFDKVIGTSKIFIKKRPIVGEMAGLTASKSASGALGDVTVDDATMVMCHFKNGALGTFEATRFATGRKNGMSFEINGSKGSVKFEFQSMNELQYYNNEDDEYTHGFKTIQVTEGVHDYAANWWPVGHTIGYEHTFVHEIYEFIQAITNDTAIVPDFYDGYMCNVLLDGIEQSIKEQTWVNIK